MFMKTIPPSTPPSAHAALTHTERTRITDRLVEIEDAFRVLNERAVDPAYPPVSDSEVANLANERHELEQRLQEAQPDPGTAKRTADAREVSRILTEWRGPDYEDELRRLAG